jgi:hypothetical protein
MEHNINDILTKIETIEELQSWLVENNLELTAAPKVATCGCEGTPIENLNHITADDVKIVVKSLSEQPIIKTITLTESSDEKENIWVVNKFESVKDLCSTSKIVYKEDTFLMNVCESNGTSTVNLILEINDEIKHIPFTLKTSCPDDDVYDMILFL